MIFQSKKLWVTLLVVIILASVGVGIYLDKILLNGVKFTPTLTMDGATTALIAVVALIATGIYVPTIVEPIIQKKRSQNAVTQELIKVLVSQLEETVVVITTIFEKNSNLTIKDRKMISDQYTKVVNFSRIINGQSDNVPSLKGYDKQIHKPLTDSKSSFLETAVASKKLTETQYLELRGSINQVIFDLIELRFNIN